MGRRYEQAGDDEAYDDYARYQQTTQKQKKPQCVSGRYEVTRPSLKSQQTLTKAKFLRVYTNGEKYIREKPALLSFSKKKFPHLDSVLNEIARTNKHICVRFLYHWPSGKRISHVDEMECEETSNIYVCADTKCLYIEGCYGDVPYKNKSGGSYQMSRNSHNSRSTNRSHKPSPTALRSHGSFGGLRQIPITVICNSKRSNKNALFIDPNSKQSFDDIMHTVSDMLFMDQPCRSLVNVNPPYTKVESISSLNRIISAGSGGDTFWACGPEEDPPERTDYLKNKSSRDASPQRNGYGSKQRHKNGGPKHNGYHDDRQMNGHHRQNDSYEDSQGREYQRHVGERRNQPDGYDSSEQSPDRRHQREESPMEQYSPTPRDYRKSQEQDNRASNRYEDRSPVRKPDNRRGGEPANRRNQPARKSEDQRNNGDRTYRGRNDSDERQQKQNGNRKSRDLDDRDRRNQRNDDRQREEDRQRDDDRHRDEDRYGDGDRNRDDGKHRDDDRYGEDDRHRDDDKQRDHGKNRVDDRHSEDDDRQRDDDHDDKKSGRRNNKSDDEDDDDKSQSGRNTPDENEMNARIEKMKKPRQNVDSDIEF